MISAIDFLKEQRDICKNAGVCPDCILNRRCVPSEMTDEQIVEVVKLLRERKEKRERNQNN